MSRIPRIAVLLTLVVALLALALPGKVSAHPMGNFSLNTYSALTVGQNAVNVLYILDIAEIPAFTEFSNMGSTQVGDLTTEQRAAYIARKAGELLPNITLKVNGLPVPLTLGAADLTFPPGNGGLPTLRLELNLQASLSGLTSGSIEYTDTNLVDRVGWKEVIALPAEGTMFKESSVPQTDLTSRLTRYDVNAISSPLRVTSASISFAPGTGTAPAPAAQPAAQEQGTIDWAKQRIEEVTTLISQENPSFGAVLIGLIAAFFWGVGHALSPGHGKAVVAAYLVGTRGTAKHALLLGLTVTISHTIGVFALGLVVLFAANFIVPDMLYPIIGFLSGMFIVVMGVAMFVQRFRQWRADRSAKSNGAVATEHEHGDTFDPAVPHSHGAFSKPHTHLPQDGKVSAGGWLTLGITGGIIPCPTALVVLLAAIAYHRVALGMAWLLAFSLGLAAVLTVLGLMVVYGKGLLSRIDRTRLGFGSGLLSRLPMASALAVAVLGFLIAFQSLQLR